MHLNRDWTMQECSRKASVVPMWVVPLCPTGVVPMCGPIVSHRCGPNVGGPNVSHRVVPQGGPNVSHGGWSQCVPRGLVPMWAQVA